MDALSLILAIAAFGAFYYFIIKPKMDEKDK